MQEKYQHAEVEQSAQSHWLAIEAYRAIEHDSRFPKGKFYACSMLPYPSGKLHMGHVRNYTINDVMYRYLRMNGYNVLMPMGWDAFGMPAENAAMANNVPPAQWTYSNIAHMKQQMQSMGFAIDWSREMTACTPEYYRWNQWMFLKMLERGIIYKKTGTVNWDPVDQTVLANEQVIDGRGWRSGAIIEKREIPMYYAKITAYTEELLEYVETKLPGWPERVRLMQSNWIGRSIGVRLAFPHKIQNANDALIHEGNLWVFTTRADTIMGVTFCAVAPEHALATLAAQSNPALANFIAECKLGSVIEADMATMEKKGMPTGLFVTHPITGDSIQVWVGNYVLTTYGDGAVMGVPAHDERDFLFAKKYNLPIRPVIQMKSKEYNDSFWQEWYGTKEGNCINSGILNGLNYSEAINKVSELLSAQGLGEKKTTYRLRDWGISRQRYWGTPIPIIHCSECGDVPVPEQDLPVILPEQCVPDGSGNPLNKQESFLRVDCPTCGNPARRETDTMDTFVDSSWYFMRYCSPNSNMTMVDKGVDYWMPMDQYIGGIEHAVLHLLYARFWTKVMRDLGLVHFDEPFVNLLTQGMVLNETYYREDSSGKKQWYNPQEIEVTLDDKGRPIAAKQVLNGLPVSIGGVEKMSKSKNNGIDPQAQIERYGADTARLFTMFASPPEQTLEWSDAGVEGAARFLRRVWTYAYTHREKILVRSALNFSDLSTGQQSVRREIHKILSQTNIDYQKLQYNTVVSACMKMLNTLETIRADGSKQSSAVITEGISILLRILNPITPHITHVLWQDLGFSSVHGDILNTPWPVLDPIALEQSESVWVIQVNGKLRGNLTLPKTAHKEAIEAAALANEQVQKFVQGTPKKIIIVPGKLINIVV